MTTTALQKANGIGDMVHADTWNEQRLKVLKDTLCTDLTDAEFALFIQVAQAKKLDPFSRQIYAIKRRNKEKKWDAKAAGGRGAMVEQWVDKLTIMTGIDGFRTLAERTGRYGGQLGPFWCARDGAWKDVWLQAGVFPAAAKVEVIRTDWKAPLVGIALWDEYAQGGKNDDGTVWFQALWKTKPTVMLAKCAEAIALRRAFPEELSGLYVTEEMQLEERIEDMREKLLALEQNENRRASPEEIVRTLPAATATTATPVPTPAAQPATVAPAPPDASSSPPPPEKPAAAPETPPPSTTPTTTPSTSTEGSSASSSVPADGASAAPPKEPDSVEDPPATTTTGARKRSTTAVLMEFRKVIAACSSQAMLDATLPSWTTALAKMPARARAMAEAYARVRAAELGGAAATEADNAMATTLNEMAKE